MEKKQLIKWLALMGLVLVDTSCEKQENQNQANNGYPSSTKSSNQQKVGFTPIAELDLPDEIDNQIIALGTLAANIFENPDVAQTFSNNPQEYLNSIGLGNTILDINSVEVKTLLALGDNDIRMALQNDDLQLFITLLQNKNYLSMNNNYISSDLENYLIKQYNLDPDLQKHIKEFPMITKQQSFVFGPVAWVIAVVAEAVAAAYNVVVSVNFGFWINVATEVNTCGTVGVATQLNNPVLKIWGLSKNEGDIPVIHELIEQNVEKVVKMVEQTDIYKAAQPTLTHDELKEWLRKPITQYFIDSDRL